MDLVVRAKKRGQFWKGRWGTVEPRAPREPQRLAKVVSEIDAVPIVADPSVQEVRLQRQFDRDSQEVAGSLGMSRQRRLGRFVEADRVTAERRRQRAVGRRRVAGQPGGSRATGGEGR